MRSNRKAIMAALRADITKKNRAAGILVSGAAKAKAPVDTGRLRSSIVWDADESGAVIGTNVEYAPIQELGSVNQTPQPFLRPGLLGSRSALMALYGKGMRL